ncbi:transglycosylase SLT domain-containing protein [Streptomyces sp. NPDC058664]|uniref:transglycosylase SLT domain-containing protein n=1 Tax=unclassified Streptomyces TaxID=2593676 RepID=UPI003648F89C
MKIFEGMWRSSSRRAVRYGAGLVIGTVVCMGVPIVGETPAAAAPASKVRVDGWISQALSVMRSNGIPGSHNGVYRNLMRESSGDPYAINLWDSNAKAGIPSKGLMQVIDPTFRAYHVEGTSWDIYDPIANIVAACNYAAHRYGTIDNVNSAY